MGHTSLAGIRDEWRQNRGQGREMGEMGEVVSRAGESRRLASSRARTSPAHQARLINTVGFEERPEVPFGEAGTVGQTRETAGVRLGVVPGVAWVCSSPGHPVIFRL